ncbi:MAG: hypothetical protein J6K81_06535 [Rikenellaceae bacterium]|nr:hypothetical protein [Rikenellaceae bacterium]
MKRLNRILIVMACAVALAGCRNDYDEDWGTANPDKPQNNIGNLTPDQENDGVHFSMAVRTQGSDATQEEFDAQGSTRTVMDDVQIYYWLVGDKIGFSAVGANDMQQKFGNVKMVNNKDGQRQATIFDGVLDTTDYKKMTDDQRYHYTAYYPYQQDAVCETDANGVLTIRNLQLRSEQNVMQVGTKGFPVDCDFMVTRPVVGGTVVTASVNDFGLEFEHLFAAVRLSIAEDDVSEGEKVTKITLTAPEGTPLTGKFEVNTSTMAVTFTEPSNSVTVNIPEGLGVGSDVCVWAIINPVDLTGKELTMTVTTKSGLYYNYTFPAKSYTRGVLHPIAFEIPDFSITADIYTNYTLYQQRKVAEANGIDGNTIFFENVTFSGFDYTDGKGGRYRVPVVARGIEYNGVRSPRAFDGGKEQISFSSPDDRKTYDAQVYAQLENGAILRSACPAVHVTGIPYEVNCKNIDYTNAGWTATGTVENWSGRGWQTYYYYPTDNFDWVYTEKKGYLFSPNFYTPEDTNVTYIARMCYFTTGSVRWPYNGQTTTIYSGPTTGTTAVETNSKSISRVGSTNNPGDNNYTSCQHNVTMQGKKRIYVADDHQKDNNLAENWVVMGSFSIKYYEE